MRDLFRILSLDSEEKLQLRGRALKIIICFIVAIFMSSEAYADKVCLDSSFMKAIPSEPDRLSGYLDIHLGEFVFFIDHGDDLAYKTGLKVLAKLIINSKIPDNKDGQWKIRMLAEFLSFREDKFINALKQLNRDEIVAVFRFYDLEIFRSLQTNDYPDIKSMFIVGVD